MRKSIEAYNHAVRKSHYQPSSLPIELTVFTRVVSHDVPGFLRR